MTNNNEERLVIQGLSIGNQANHNIAEAIAERASAMLDQALSDNFETILQAQVSAAVQETLNLHAERTQAFAKKFLGTSKTQLAKNLVETQHQHRLAALQNNLQLDELEAFDTDLEPEVQQLADKAGTITVEADPESEVGF